MLGEVVETVMAKRQAITARSVNKNRFFIREFKSERK